LDFNWEKYTLEDWWQEFEDYILSEEYKRKPVTHYATTYANELNKETKENDIESYAHALVEQMAETFSGYMLWIYPNDEWETDFRKHAWKAWDLMDKLCKSTLVSDDREINDEIEENN
jgi:hypothetical protein